jgi:hypothetical protein
VTQSAKLLRSILNRERIGLLVVTLVFFGFAVAIDLPEWRWFLRRMNMQGPPGAFVWVLRILALGLALGGVWALRRALRSFPIEKNPVWQLVVLHPAEIVWVHSGLETEYRAYGVTVNRQRNVFFLTVDPARNQRIETFVHQASALEEFLRDELPKATFGFSQARMIEYRAVPRSLYKK